jgi:Cu(I)/Ag(I) efflux system membrane fusion protein
MRKTILIALFAAVGGLLLGYLLFTKSNNESIKTSESVNQIWTCSMHPQIRKDAPGDCPICGMDLIPLENSSGDDPLIFEMTPESIKIAGIKTYKIGGLDGESSKLVLSGRITTDETRTSSLVSHIPGRIEKLYVSFTGEQVNKGQRLAKIYSPNLIAAQKELLEANKIKDDQPGLFEAAKNKMRYWKISNKVINEILKSGKVKEFFDVHALYSGVIKTRKVSVGDYLKKGEVLFDVQNLNALWAVFDVYEKDLSSVKLGDEISFTATAMPGKKFNSKISFIDPVINPATRTTSVRLEVSNSSKQLKPDMFLKGEINGSETGGAVIVPKSAVLWTGTRSVVYISLPDVKVPSFEYREVVLGGSSGDYYEIIEGLSVGDEVVSNGAFVIDASAQLNNRMSMMNKTLVDVEKRQLPVREFEGKLNSEFTEQLSNVVNGYLRMKDVLVKSDLDKSKHEAETLKELVNKADMSLLEGSAHVFWMKKQKAIINLLDKIFESKEIEEIRTNFDALSLDIIQVVRSFKIRSELYIQYCPMADSDKGAFWLSAEKNIRNPYFGDAMLKCGVIKPGMNQ